MQNNSIAELQKKLTDELINKKFIKTKEVEKAFLSVPRHLFLPGVAPEQVYSNTAIVTKWDGKFPVSSSSEPAVYAIMLEQLELKEGMKILEVGAGTGFNAALMAQMTGENGKVITVDIDKDIADSARKNLNSAGYENVKVICKDGASGYEPDAPYDRIIVTAGAWDIYPGWFEQLKPGGMLLVPMVINIQDQATFAFERVNDRLESRSISGCKFMELRSPYNRQAKWLEIGIGKVLMFCSGIISEVNDELSGISVKSQFKDFSADIMLSIQEIYRQLLPWLEITEPKFCLLVSKIETAQILNMPVFPKHKGKSLPVLFGLADSDSLCLMYLTNEKTASGTVDPDSKTYKLHVRNFSAGNKTVELLVEKLTEWDKAGRPGLQNAKVNAYFGKRKASKNEYIIEKENVSLIFNWE